MGKKLFLTNEGYISDRERTTEWSCTDDSGFYKGPFIIELEKVLKRSKKCTESFIPKEHLVLPIEFILGEELSYGK